MCPRGIVQRGDHGCLYIQDQLDLVTIGRVTQRLVVAERSNVGVPALQTLSGNILELDRGQRAIVYRPPEWHIPKNKGVRCVLHPAVFLSCTNILVGRPVLSQIWNINLYDYEFETIACNSSNLEKLC